MHANGVTTGGPHAVENLNVRQLYVPIATVLYGTWKRMTNQEQKKKDDIIEGILEHQGDLLDPKYIPIIANAMRRMPLDVLDTISSDRNVRFMTITDQFYAVTEHLFDPRGRYPPKERALMPPADWQLVIINDMMMNKLNSEEDKESVIAHELAHVYLRHITSPDNDKSKDEEQEADDLISSWGLRPIQTKNRQII